MKRFAFLLALPLILAGCGSTSASYQLLFDTTNSTMRNALTLTSVKVVERRLERFETTMEDQSIEPNGSGAILTVKVKDGGVLQPLTEELTAPFKLRIMKGVPEGQGDINVQGHGDFKETGITEKDLMWAEAAEDDKKKGAVHILFTPAGQTKLGTLFAESKDKDIGIFVRDRLISKLTVKTDERQTDIVIRDIPSPELAKIFVDDLNVGLHVIFKPLP